MKKAPQEFPYCFLQPFWKSRQAWVPQQPGLSGICSSSTCLLSEG